ncbi:MAG: pyridoxamine 5'-phosphate oxidase family protein [Acidimicrobiales bacterium]|nr:pyridoxamine 5'-phosphate oxidase family protein [Acidimicrobiales bacterium]
METPADALEAGRMTSTAATTTSTTATADDAARRVFHPDPAKVRRAVERRSVATLATVSHAGRPHAATVLYQCVDDALFVSTHRDSRKARNVAGTGGAAVAIAVRRLPVGPPASVQFQASASVLANDDPEIVRLASAGRLDDVTGHGELDLDGGCFLRIALPARAVTYALGMSLWHVLRNPLDAAGEVDLRMRRPTDARG